MAGQTALMWAVLKAVPRDELSVLTWVLLMAGRTAGLMALLWAYRRVVPRAVPMVMSVPKKAGLKALL
jgi:hypothetical protein